MNFEKSDGNFNFQLFFQTNWSYGWSRFSTAVHPPPPYQPAQYSMHSTMASTYGLKQPQQAIHLLQNNTREVRWRWDSTFFACNYDFEESSQSMSPGSVTSGMSPSYSEPSPDYSMLMNQNRLPRPASNSPPPNNTQNLTTHIGSKNKRSVMKLYCKDDERITS